MAKNKLNQVYNIDSRHILESIPQNIEIQTTITTVFRHERLRF